MFLPLHMQACYAQGCHPLRLPYTFYRRTADFCIELKFLRTSGLSRLGLGPSHPNQDGAIGRSISALISAAMLERDLLM